MATKTKIMITLNTNGHVTGLCCHGSISVPETWLKFTNDNIERSRSERKASSDLRALAKETLENCAAALLHQWHATNDALTERVRQYTEAKHKLQNHLSKVYELLLSFHPFFIVHQILHTHLLYSYCVRRSRLF